MKSAALPARRLLLGLAIADLVVFGAWIGREEVARRAGVEVRLPVEGFDPRDLLSGHYARFQLAALGEAYKVQNQEEHPPRDRPATSSYCLEVRAGGLAHVARRRLPGDACPLWISAKPDKYARIDFGVDRFYVDERRRDEVARISAGDGTYLVARIFDGGRIHPVDLVLNGKSVRGR